MSRALFSPDEDAYRDQRHRESEIALHGRGVLCVPDFLANAGGVIAAVVEHRGGDTERAFTAIAERIRANTIEMFDRVRQTGLPPRQAAETMACERLSTARRYRRRFR